MIYDIAMASIQSYAIDDDIWPFVVNFITKYSIWALIIGIYKIVMFVFMCLDSDADENDYGESPKYINDDEDEPVYVSN